MKKRHPLAVAVQAPGERDVRIRWLVILMGGHEHLYSKTPDRLASPITALVTQAVKAGACQPDVEPPDLLRALSGIATIRVSKNWKHSAVRMVCLLLAGMSAEAPDHGSQFEPHVLATRSDRP